MALTDTQVQMYRTLAATPAGSDPNDLLNWRAISAAQILEREGIPLTAGPVTADTQYPGGFLPSEHPGVTPPSWYTPYATSPTAAAPAPAPDTTAARSAFDPIAQMLTEAGLGSLFTIGPDGSPGGWAWDQLIDDPSPVTFQLRLEQRPEFIARYGVIGQMRQAFNEGKVPYVPTVKNVLDYRRTVTETLRGAGLPTWFYDDNGDFDRLMLQGLSPVEIEDHLGKAWTMVHEADPAIRATFSEFYGIGDGDAALAAFFLDPVKTNASLEKAARAAYAGGSARNKGFSIDRTVAESIAQLPITEAGIEQGLAEVAGMHNVFTESISEGAVDLTTGTGVDASLLGDGQAQTAIAKRIAERRSLNQQAAGGAAVTNKGVVGI